MKQPVDFRPEKPRIDLPDTSRKPSVRLPGALTLPDGRTMLDPPTIDLGEVFIPSPQDDNMTTLSNREMSQTLFFSDRPISRPHKISGTETLFQSGDLLDRLDSIVEGTDNLHEKLELPEIPPLPSWEKRFEEHCSQKCSSENTMLPHADFRTSFETDATSSTFDLPAPELLETVITGKQPKITPPSLRPRRPTVFRKKVRPAKSLELLLPQTAFSGPSEVEPVPEVAKVFFPVGDELLLTEGLTKSYYKKKLKIPVLKGVDFYVNPGEFVSIVGQSGSGKSTLLHLLGTLDNPESGTIRFEGRRIDNLPASKRDKLRNRSIGFIFQFYHLLPELSTLENVLSPLMIRESAWNYFFKRKHYVERAKEILAQVGLSHRLKHKPCELSGGEMQRAAIARALISEPKILLADEPTGNLDSSSAREIIELLRTLKQERNLTIVMVTHDNTIANVADRIVRMIDGIIVSVGDSVF